MPKRLTAEEKDSRAKAAAAKKEAAAAKKKEAAAAKKATAEKRLEKKLKPLRDLIDSEMAKLGSGTLSASHAHVVNGRIRALSDQIRTAMDAFSKKF